MVLNRPENRRREYEEVRKLFERVETIKGRLDTYRSEGREGIIRTIAERGFNTIGNTNYTRRSFLGLGDNSEHCISSLFEKFLEQLEWNYPVPSAYPAHFRKEGTLDKALNVLEEATKTPGDVKLHKEAIRDALNRILRLMMGVVAETEKLRDNRVRELQEQVKRDTDVLARDAEFKGREQAKKGV